MGFMSKAVRQVPRNKSQRQRSTRLETLSLTAQSSLPAATLTQHALPPSEIFNVDPTNCFEVLSSPPLSSIHPPNQIPPLPYIVRKQTIFTSVSEPQFPSNRILPTSLLQSMASSSTADCNNPRGLINPSAHPPQLPDASRMK